MTHSKMPSKYPSLVINRRDFMDHHDLARIQSDLGHGDIFFLNFEKFFTKNQDNALLLRNTIETLKKMVLRKGGSFGRIGENILVLNPRKDVKLS